MQELNTHIDPVFEKLKEAHTRSRNIANPLADEMLDLVKEEISENPDFRLKEAMLAVSQLAMYVSQSLFSNHEEFVNELDCIEKQTLHRVVNSFYPKMDGSKIIEEGYDLDNLSLRRMFTTLAGAMDAIIWQSELSTYKEERLKEEENEIKEETEVADA